MRTINNLHIGEPIIGVHDIQNTNNVDSNTYEYYCDNRLFYFNLARILHYHDDPYPNLYSNIESKPDSDEESNIVITPIKYEIDQLIIRKIHKSYKFSDEIFEFNYYFIFHFVIVSKTKFIVTKVEYITENKIIYFDNFEYPKYENTRFIMYDVHNDTFILDLVDCEYIYVSNISKTKLNYLTQKINSNEIFTEINKQHTYNYCANINGTHTVIFWTYNQYSEDKWLIVHVP